jgi:antitoxin (DNA-binding transcriptional repressor) of toxin-antitoxin stability system
MSRSITATNLRTDLREILLDLDAGPVEITKHGKVVAVLSRPIPADLLESSDPAVVCTTDESAPPCDTCADVSDDAPALTALQARIAAGEAIAATRAAGVEQHADEMRSRGALAVDASDGSQEPSDEPVEASEGEDTSEPVSASQEATEAEEGGPRADSPYKLDVEAATGRGQEFYFTEEDDRNLEAEFDAWLAAGQPDDEIGEPAAW